MRFPLIGREQKAEGVRKLVTPLYPYLVDCTFEAADDEIIVLSVLHAKQKRRHEET